MRTKKKTTKRQRIWNYFLAIRMIRMKTEFDVYSTATFIVHMLFGTFFIPLCIYSIVHLGCGILLDLLEEYELYNVADIAQNIVACYEYAQWPIYAFFVVRHWYRTNIRLWCYSNALEWTAALAYDKTVCPRCGSSMGDHSFTTKEKVWSGTHEESKTVWESYNGSDGYTHMEPRTERYTVDDYEDVDVTHSFVRCSNPCCHFTERSPYNSFYKFTEMPGKFEDAKDFILTIDTVLPLSYGFSTLKIGRRPVHYVVATAILLILSLMCGLNPFDGFLFLPDNYIKLSIILSVLLAACIAIQIIVCSKITPEMCKKEEARKVAERARSKREDARLQALVDSLRYASQKDKRR